MIGTKFASEVDLFFFLNVQRDAAMKNLKRSSLKGSQSHLSVPLTDWRESWCVDEPAARWKVTKVQGTVVTEPLYWKTKPKWLTEHNLARRDSVWQQVDWLPEWRRNQHHVPWESCQSRTSIWCFSFTFMPSLCIHAMITDTANNHVPPLLCAMCTKSSNNPCINV